MLEFIAMEITSPEIATIARMVNPDLKDYDYEHELEGNFLVFGFPEAGRSSLIQPRIFSKYFSHIENGDVVTLKRFMKTSPPEEDPLRKTPFIQH